MKKESKKNTTKKEEFRRKNIAEKFIVGLCWFCFFIALYPLLIPSIRDYSGYFTRLSGMAGCRSSVKYYPAPDFVKFFDVHNHLLLWMFLFLGGIILLCYVLLTISKRTKNPHIRPEYYKILLGFLWVILLELFFIMSYMANHPC